MSYIIGIDEVGRGSLAGPVVVAAAAFPLNFRLRNKHLGKLKDSKKLTPQKRQEWFAFLSKHSDIVHAVARVYPRGIERFNISGAANRAAHKAFTRLCSGLGIVPEDCRVFLDGGLYLGKNKNAPYAKTIVRGDEKIAAIKAASILAKVKRDRFMEKIAKRYGAYGFEFHKGYATKMHCEAIKTYGPSEIHRKTFLSKVY